MYYGSAMDDLTVAYSLDPSNLLIYNRIQITKKRIQMAAQSGQNNIARLTKLHSNRDSKIESIFTDSKILDMFEQIKEDDNNVAKFVQDEKMVEAISILNDFTSKL
jgi:hypothetical protein